MSQSILPWVRSVVVGSTNPAKIAAVRAVIARVAPDAIVHAANVASGVPDQPWGDAETRRGAARRARGALEQEVLPAADLGVGIEGGVVLEEDGRLRTCAWAVVRARDGRQGTGGSLSLELPEAVATLVKQGSELGHAMDIVSKSVHTKHGAGAVGILTAGLIDRQCAYEPLVTYALSPFLANAYYERVVLQPQDGVSDAALPPGEMSDADGR